MVRSWVKAKNLKHGDLMGDITGDAGIVKLPVRAARTRLRRPIMTY